MPDKAVHKVQDRDYFFHIGIILMPVVMEGDRFAVIFVDPGGGNDRTSQIASDVFYGSFGVTFVWFGVYIEAILMFPVTESPDLFKRGAGPVFQQIKQCGAESITEEGIVKMIHVPPEAVIAVSAFGNGAVDVWVPFQIPAEGMQDHNKTGSKVHGFILFEKQAGNNVVYGMEEAVQESPVIEEKIPEVFINGKNTVTMEDVDQFKGHGGSALHGIEIAAGRTETAVAAEGNKFQLTTVRAAIHGPTESRIAAVNHFLHVFNDRGTWA